MTKTESKILALAAADPHGMVPIDRHRQHRAAAWLHMQGYGIWFRDTSTFRLFPLVKKAILNKAKKEA